MDITTALLAGIFIGFIACYLGVRLGCNITLNSQIQEDCKPIIRKGNYGGTDVRYTQKN